MFSDNKKEEYLDFLTYVLIHAASADSEIGDAERESIKKKASALEFDEVLSMYKTHSSDDRSDYLNRMSEKWLKTDDSKRALVEKVQHLTGVDLEVNADEKTVYQELKKIIL